MSCVLENPRGGCVLAGISSVLGAMNRVCPIFHSGPGCAMQTTAADQGQSGHKSSAFVNSVSTPSSNMLEREVVFGGVGKLRTTIQGAIDIIDADAYFILTGCTAGIIGDDIQSVAEEFQAEGEQVYPIDVPGFMGDSNLGYEVVWTTMIDKVMEPHEVDPKLVNVFGIVPYRDPFWSGTLEEIDRILTGLGLRVNTFFTKGQGIETVKTCSAAALNIIVSPWLFSGPAKKFERKFGTPSLRIPEVFIGATDTSKFVRQVAAVLDLDSAAVERFIYSEEEYVYRYLAQSIGVVSWKRFAVIADAGLAVGLTRYLANDFSFTPVLVVISEPLFRSEDKARIEAELTNLEYARPPKVVFAADQYDINQAVLTSDEEITLILGSSNDREVALEIDAQFILASFPMSERLIFNRTYAGYRGSLTFTEDLYDNY